MPDQLHFTESDEANALIASDPMALLVGFVLDQQVTVQKAFSGPLALKERLGSIDAATLASADLDPVFRERSATSTLPRRSPTTRRPSASTRRSGPRARPRPEP